MKKTHVRLQVFFCMYVLACLISVSLHGQKKFNIGVRSGLQTFLLNDDIGSNLNYSGSGMSVLVSLEALKTSQIHHLDLYYASPELSNSFSERFAKSRIVTINYSYQRKIAFLKDLNSTIYLGPYLKMKSFYRSYEYPRDFGYPSSSTGEFFGSVGLKFSVLRPIGEKHSLRLELGVPVLSYIINQEFSGSSTSDYLYLNKLIDYNFGLSYTHLLKGKVSLLTKYGFNFFSLDRANDVQYGSHSFLVGLQLTL